LNVFCQAFNIFVLLRHCAMTDMRIMAISGNICSEVVLDNYDA